MLKRPCNICMLDFLCVLNCFLPHYTFISLSVEGLEGKKSSINLSKQKTMFFIRKVVRHTCTAEEMSNLHKLPLVWKFPRWPSQHGECRRRETPVNRNLAFTLSEVGTCSRSGAGGGRGSVRRENAPP